MYKLKDAVRRSSMLLGAVGLMAGLGASAILPASASADDTLNPLTNRSLTLSSSSPGWSYYDGSGNQTYAAPNSGENGQETGNTFSFTQSTGGTVNAMSFQYCTYAAGTCWSPGNDGYTGTSPAETRSGDSVSGQASDLSIVTSSPSEISSSTYSAINLTPGGSNPAQTRDNTCYESDGTTVVPDCAFKRPSAPSTLVTDEYPQMPKVDGSEGNFVVLQNGTYSANWYMATANDEDGVANGVGTGDNDTGKQNMIILENSGNVTVSPNDTFKVIFYANETNYITNPGGGYFFVKINDYNDTNTPAGSFPYYTDSGQGTGPTLLDVGDFGPSSPYILDGGVTVANMMNQSIQIQTKVLETMDFSVGTVDPDTLSSAQLTAAGDSSTEGSCSHILNSFTTGGAQNSLILGNEDAEDSLMTTDAFATHSYFRLSSNSSGGATVYYSGVPLSNTEGNQIDQDGMTSGTSTNGTEQFGLGLDITSGTHGTTEQPDYTVAASNGSPTINFEAGTDTDNGVDTPSTSGLSAYWTANKPANAHDPQLAPLEPASGYGSASGDINTFETNWSTPADDASFSFNPNSNTVPQPIADESNQVVDCVTGKVRYLANIAATTAAGIYTTKINYIAAPEY